jgi:maltooligosyltrehalose trehalohydrolase
MNPGHTVKLPFGAELLDSGQTRFSLWAPALQQAWLELEDSGPLPMQRDEDGVFSVTADCGAGSRYRYRVGDELSVPDPASRAQAGGVHGHSVVVDPHAYAWKHRDWNGRPWPGSVIYELHVGCYGGSFAEVAKRLPHLKELGVSAVELMPIADFSGTRNWGYDGVLPYAPSAAYGTPDELKALIDTAHGLGLCIYLDVVYNHFGPDGNYLHSYAPQFFDERRTSSWGPAIDFKRPQVREFFIANALYWLMEYRFDGLRLDAVHAIGDSDFLDELASRVRAGAEPGRHVHLVLENEHNDATRLEAGYDAQWNDDGHNVLHVLLTGETESYYRNYAEVSAAKLARCLAEGFVYQGEPSPSHGGRPRGTPSSGLAPDRFVLFLQNHDQVGNRALGERLSLLAKPQALRAAIALQLLSPQTPLLFMGEEWGAEEPFLFFTDFHEELADAVREGRRKEFAAFPAFANPKQRAAIPDPNAESTFRRSCLPAAAKPGAQSEQLAYYRRLLKIRNETIGPALAGTRSLGAAAVGPAAVAASWQLGDGAVLWLGINLGGVAAKDDAPAGTLLFESLDGCGAAAAQGILQAHSCSAWLEARA